MTSSHAGNGSGNDLSMFSKKEPRPEATEKYPKDLLGQEAGADGSKWDL